MPPNAMIELLEPTEGISQNPSHTVLCDPWTAQYQTLEHHPDAQSIAAYPEFTHET